MNGAFSIPLLHNTVSIMTPFLLAAIGGLFTQLAGVLNIALEGLMLVGAFFSIVFAAVTGSLFLGIVLGIAASVLVSLLFGVISLRLKANIFVAGLATNLLATGLTTVLSYRLFQNKGVVRFPDVDKLPALVLPGLQRIPIFGDVLFGHNVIVYASWVFLVLATVVIYRTPFGLRLRATGLAPATIVSLGLKPERFQLSAIAISGLTCGLAGSLLTLNLSAFVPNITAGRGWIALVVIYLGNKTPVGILIASFVFGFAESFSNYAQGVTDIPADFILALPYIITVTAMVIYSIWQSRKLS